MNTYAHNKQFEQIGNGTLTLKPEITYSCGFETTEQCFFKQASWDSFDWNRGSGSTPTSGTGPTSAAEGIYYMFIETDNRSRYLSAVLDTDGTKFQVSIGHHSVPFKQVLVSKSGVKDIEVTALKKIYSFKKT
ncbi:Hypothetical predicted protein [Mytilus galloprovincialis]|uniref:MAM domain-containing protein n=1 Tax=Mytilus galloprovincialis TaxID=29158 RepID=A0A8B6FY38_MYTGA|nr:Hypothetical predicted protein [Mytilus galloprovincialis]